MIKGILLSLITEVYAGSCYYEHINVFTPNPFEFYTNTTTHYEYCLAGCCGAYKRGGINQCCDSTGVTIGILIALMLFVGLVVTAGFVYRQKRRRLLLVNDVSSERDRLVRPGSPSNLSSDGPKQYQSHEITQET
ncbi:Hypothetical predicted protein [Mytilus galloprovincialis]|uniref:Uncharacterized protein n=1 Tax=Mytilus galloprovincialis TaxID=29158 RepID=A0A8B6H6E4_MYTGA|nr:Hypothetical predicted protein [Mytilus galloprovincialis]